MGTSVRLGKILGIPLGISYSWFIIFALVTFFLATFTFPARFPDWPLAAYWLVGLSASLLFFGCIVAHELAHSVVSIATGIPVKGITLFVFGGVAQVEREASRPRDEILMASAGPLASFALALVFYGLSIVAQPFSEPLAMLAWWLAITNFFLGALNLFPGFPLDGGRVLRSVIWSVNGSFVQATRIACICGKMGGYLAILIGLFYIFRGMLIDGIWIGFMGWFLSYMAEASLRQALARHSLEGLTARDLMSGDFPLITPTLTIGQLVRDHLLRSAQRTYLVAQGEELLGLISPQGVKLVPRNRWDVTAVREVMVPVARLKKASLAEDAASLLDRMDELNLSQLPVEDEGRIVGLVRRDSLLQFIRTRGELGV